MLNQLPSFAAPLLAPLSLEALPLKDFACNDSLQLGETLLIDQQLKPIADKSTAEVNIILFYSTTEQTDLAIQLSW